MPKWLGSIGSRLRLPFYRSEADLDNQLEQIKEKTLREAERADKLRDVLAAKELLAQKKGETRRLRRAIKGVDKAISNKEDDGTREGTGAGFA